MKFQLAFTTFIALSSAVALKPRDDNDDDNRRQVGPAAAATTTPVAPVAPAPARPEGCTDDDDDDDDARCRVGAVAPAPAQPNTTPTATPTGYRNDDDDDDDDDDCYDDGNDRFRSEVPGCAGRNTRVPGQPRPTTPAPVGAAPTARPGDDDDDDDDDCYDDDDDRFRSEDARCVGRNTRVPGQPRPTTPVGAAPVNTTRGIATSTTRAANGTATRTGIVASFTGGAVPVHITTGWVAGAVVAVAGLLAY
ncbi:hypothetical protein BDZ85DRAFT_246417 [Elsinoe ampelina]|uniref:Uncharacterized protein n=1 Tax=Elsinoe ampelina TaxID=302913 RepID=A0A6A6GQV1_9PEZI|nr:hypothetical protein BDZ85DRAFT_246417 [Elsinoe ampelina]